jgi:2-polyprenyl-3-methyl-5-hydroxy-6-metoxy-1,4-benzoquinol methylase
LARKGEIVLQYCNFCHSQLSNFKEGIYDTRFGVTGNFDIYRCNACNLVQLGLEAGHYNTKELYETYYNFSGCGKSSYTKYRKAFFDSNFYRFWMLIDGDISFHSRRGKGKLLDIGCNEGRNLQIYAKNGFSVEGFEVNKRAATEAKKCGHKIYNQSMDTFLPNKTYDIVVLSNVLEHSTDPLKLLQNINKILKPGGRIWISVPNINSWQRLIFNRYWINWHVPFHVFFFSVSTISNLLTTSGFSKIKSSNLTPGLWMAQSIIATFFTESGKKNNAQRIPVLLGCLLLTIRFFLFPLLCFGNLIGRGDCLIIEAFKNDSF